MVKMNPTKGRFSQKGFVVGTFLRSSCQATGRTFGDRMSLLVLIVGAS